MKRKAIAVYLPARVNEMLTWIGLFGSLAIVVYFTGANGLW